MNSIEEKLWNYIDGTCTPEEHEAISILIAQDEVYKRKYEELLLLNSEFSAMELEEPPMAFTYNVMEGIRADYAKKPLKAAIDQRIIKGIGAFFIITILGLLIYALAGINWSAMNFSAPAASFSFKVPDLKSYLNGPIVRGFLYFDIVLALFLFDSVLRRRNLSKQV